MSEPINVTMKGAYIADAFTEYSDNNENANRITHK